MYRIAEILEILYLIMFFNPKVKRRIKNKKCLAVVQRFIVCEAVTLETYIDIVRKFEEIFKCKFVSVEKVKPRIRCGEVTREDISHPLYKSFTQSIVKENIKAMLKRKYNGKFSVYLTLDKKDSQAMYPNCSNDEILNTQLPSDLSNILKSLAYESKITILNFADHFSIDLNLN